MANQYTPWVDMKMTEAEYYKARYIEARMEIAELEAEKNLYWEQLEKIEALARFRKRT